MLGDISTVDNIYIITGYTDMRKNIDGLCTIILNHMKADPDRHAIYLFCGRRSDRIKVLLREPDGYVMLYKRLKPITWQQFDWLMSGLDIEQPRAWKTA